MNKYNNFELLLSAASEECCNKMADRFLSAETDNIITPAERRRFNKINRNFRNKSNNKFTALKVVAVACLICLSLCFIACMCITKIRDAIKETIIEWHDGFAAIEFMSNDIQTLNNDIPMPPTKIINKAHASYLPSSLKCEVKADTYNYYVQNYYSDNEFRFSLFQQTICCETYLTNSKNKTFHKLTINGYEGILIEDSNDPDLYSIIWQTDSYRFSLVGKFSNAEEAIKIASGVVND